MSADAAIDAAELRVDGGAASNDLLLQFQADILKIPVVRPVILETTALGAAYLAGLAVGYWQGYDEIAAQWKRDETFHAAMAHEEVTMLCRNWEKARGRSERWIEE